VHLAIPLRLEPPYNTLCIATAWNELLGLLHICNLLLSQLGIRGARQA
jgi:hypothetical protein